MTKYIKLLFLFLILIDLAYLNLLVLNKPPSAKPVTPNPSPIPTITDNCGPECQKYIDSKFSAIPTVLPTVKKTVSPRTKVRSISYLPVPGSGSTTANDWAGINGTDFYFDTRDYSGLVSIYFETNLHLFNGNGIAFVRLFDATHGVGVQGSEVKTVNQADTAVESGQVSFYAGKNLIRVQAKSLTADTTIFTSGRLKITTEN